MTETIPNPPLGSSIKSGPWHLLYPAIIFLLLGLGNYYVGKTKSLEYGYQLELIDSPSPSSFNLPPLAKFEYLRQQNQRIYETRFRAQKSKRYYDLVKFGGKAFLILSITFFLGAIGKNYCRNK